MPARPAHDTLQRLIALLKAIPVGKPGRNTSQLAEVLEAAGYKTTARSLQRDLIRLKETFSLVCDDGSRPFQWYWTGGDPSGVAALTTPEALALVLVEQHLKQALPAHLMTSFDALFERARARLKQLGPNNRQPRWLSKVRAISPILPQKAPTLSPAVQAAIAEALMNDHQLEVEHQSTARDTPKQLTLNPLALILRGATLYLAATAQGYEDVRLYAVHRIKRAAELPKPASIPRGYDIDQQIADGLGQFGDSPVSRERLKLVLLCEARLARQLEESPLSADQRITKLRDGRAQVSATVVKSWQLQWWLLARLESAEVIAPAAYREEIAALLDRGAARYRTTPLMQAA